MNKEQDLFLAEVMIRLNAIEKLLIKSGIFTPSDLTSEMKKISEDVIRAVKNNS